MLPIEDEIIIDRYIARDERAISYTADKYGKQLIAIANRICYDLDDSLELLQVVEVESRNGPTALDSSCEHFLSVHKTDFLVIYCHNCLKFIF